MNIDIIDIKAYSENDRGIIAGKSKIKKDDVLKLDIDPKSHYAWTGGAQKILDKGRVSKYNKKFSNLRSKK